MFLQNRGLQRFRGYVHSIIMWVRIYHYSSSQWVHKSDVGFKFVSQEIHVYMYLVASEHFQIDLDFYKDFDQMSIGL